MSGNVSRFAASNIAVVVRKQKYALDWLGLSNEMAGHKMSAPDINGCRLLISADGRKMKATGVETTTRRWTFRAGHSTFQNSLPFPDVRVWNRNRF